MLEVLRRRMPWWQLSNVILSAGKREEEMCFFFVWISCPIFFVFLATQYRTLFGFTLFLFFFNFPSGLWLGNLSVVWSKMLPQQVTTKSVRLMVQCEYFFLTIEILMLKKQSSSEHLLRIKVLICNFTGFFSFSFFSPLFFFSSSACGRWQHWMTWIQPTREQIC